MTKIAPLCALLLAACGGTTTTETEAPTGTTNQAGSTNAANDQAEVPDQPPAENAAPEFALPDLDGNKIDLADYKGKVVVLEWFNPGCPFVKYAYSQGPLKDMAQQKTSAGIGWLEINSGAPGKQGNGVDINRKAAKQWGIDTPLLMDETGEVGKQYGARTTPHMFVINEQGSIVYKGALDNAPLGRVPTEGRVNYVDAALADLAAGRAVQVSETKSYGCSVKYAE